VVLIINGFTRGDLYSTLYDKIENLNYLKIVNLFDWNPFPQLAILFLPENSKITKLSLFSGYPQQQQGLTTETNKTLNRFIEYRLTMLEVYSLFDKNMANAISRSSTLKTLKISFLNHSLALPKNLKKFYCKQVKEKVDLRISSKNRLEVISTPQRHSRM
jgi:hypothetical protein